MRPHDPTQLHYAPGGPQDVRPWARRHVRRYQWAVSYLRPEARVLDLGCGDGYDSSLLACSCGLACALDVDHRAVLGAADRYRDAGVRWATGSATDLPFAPGCFDLVTCFEVLEHLREPLVALTEIHRVLRPGGLCLLSVPNPAVDPANSAQVADYHLLDFTPASFRDLVGAVFPGAELLGQPGGGSVEIAVSRARAWILLLKRRIGLRRALLPLAVRTWLGAQISKASGSGEQNHGFETDPDRIACCPNLLAACTKGEPP